jgi:2-phosphosulfolactate phosphatase
MIESLRNCSSGRELIDRGFERDVELAAELNVSETVPVLKKDAFVGQRQTV